jgi:hypothetical protein
VTWILRSLALEAILRNSQHQNIFSYIALIRLCVEDMLRAYDQSPTMPPLTIPYLRKIRQLAHFGVPKNDEELVRDLVTIQLCALAFEGQKQAMKILDRLDKDTQ